MDIVFVSYLLNLFVIYAGFALNLLQFSYATSRRLVSNRIYRSRYICMVYANIVSGTNNLIMTSTWFLSMPSFEIVKFKN